MYIGIILFNISNKIKMDDKKKSINKSPIYNILHQYYISCHRFTLHAKLLTSLFPYC